ncbi:hypothetical protein I4U23_002244 [Adineta vaga]|nr:hypothetical protein I4U23_002244 [Adineta vaga]
MTEFWKSGEKHFCTFCKCWLAGNKISINLHESGNHHKSMVRAKVEQLRKASVEKERESKQFNETLGKIERAANESYRRDMANNAITTANSSQQGISTSSDANLPSKLKRPANEPIQIQMKKPKFIIKTPTPKPVYEPIDTPSESETKVPEKEEIPKVEESVTSKNVPEEKQEPVIDNNDTGEGIWYESKTANQESFYWNDTTGESTWTPPAVYLSIEKQRAKGLNV